MVQIAVHATVARMAVSRGWVKLGWSQGGAGMGQELSQDGLDLNGIGLERDWIRVGLG